MNDLLELYGSSTARAHVDWHDVIQQEGCPYLNHRCHKTRKSTPKITIGTCSIRYGRDEKQIIICPYRLLERGQIFLDSLHLLTLHEPGNELHIVSEVTIPQTADQSYRLDLDSRFSTNADGVARSLGLQADPNLALEKILAFLENKISEHTLFVLR